MTDWHPDADDDRPVRTERRRRLLRAAVLVALVAMVLPIVLSAFGVARSAAERACATYAADFSADASGHVSFDLLAEGGPGWLCFARPAGAGHDTLLGNLGPMPGAPRNAPGRDA
ncbi:hypothetical protein ACFPER_18200 [Agromyces aurantiacus]|uniref:Uncharacterized protein n=1 Tax=Agromyces aurantiacus TaxID=165814 RepID=A0ABV9RC20_9MICO|nr:hypothetical protein [Agromyces aurantiacus]MBM7505423.1 hypothetical protein [Agromyces aurantiacus]